MRLSIIHRELSVKSMEILNMLVQPHIWLMSYTGSVQFSVFLNVIMFKSASTFKIPLFYNDNSLCVDIEKIPCRATKARDTF